MHRPRAKLRAPIPASSLTSAYRSTTAPASPCLSTAAISHPKEAAVFLRLSEITLARWRIEGTGPSYRKFGRRVVYGKVDLLAWADGQTQQNTSQAQSRAARTVK